MHWAEALTRASTAGSFLTTAFFFAILMTPSARVTVTTMGKPSGMAATAKLVAAHDHSQWQSNTGESFLYTKGARRCHFHSLVLCGTHLTAMVNMSRMFLPTAKPAKQMTPMMMKLMMLSRFPKPSMRS